MGEFYEPCYESGKPERYRVTLTDTPNFCAGGLWSWWVDRETGEGLVSFSLLTMNCDDHPVLNRLHKPDDEKRTLYLVPPGEYDAWLNATPDEARAMLTLSDPDRVVIAPAPKPAKASTRDSA